MADVKIKLQTILDPKGLRQLRKQGQDIGKSLKKGFAVAGAAAAGFVAVTVGAVKLNQELALLADASTQANRNFVNLSGGAESAEENLLALNRALRGTVADTGALNIANKFLGTQVAETADELEQFITLSRRLGATFRGLGTEDAAQEFALLLANMSTPRLDSFGISAAVVKERVDELTDGVTGLSREAAFNQAVLEEGTKILEILGPEVVTTQDRIDRLSASFANLRTTVSLLGATDDTLGFFDKNLVRADELIKAFDDVIKKSKEIEGLSFAVDTDTRADEVARATRNAEFLGGVLGRVNPALGELAENFLLVGVEATKAADAEIKAQESALAEANRTAEARQNLADEQDRLDKAARDRAALAEAAAKEAERVLGIRRRFALDLVREDKRTTERITDIWDDFADSREDGESDHAKRLGDIRKRFAKAAKKDNDSLAKDLANLDKDLQRDTQRAQNDSQKDDKNQRKRARVDALADERLFNFELKQLAADGQGAAILEAIERREIEEEIAREKAAVENEIEKDQRSEELATIRETGDERRAQLQQDSAEEKAAREADLAEAITDENESFTERLANLAEFRDESLQSNRETSAENLEELAIGLVLQGDLQQRELAKFVAVAAIRGVESGAALARGMAEGFRTNLNIANILGADVGAAGTTINNNVPVNVSGIGGDVLAGLIESGVNGALQEFTDEVLIPSFE